MRYAPQMPLMLGVIRHWKHMTELSIPRKLRKALEREAKDAKLSLPAHIVKKLERITPPTEAIDKKVIENGLPKLVEYLNQIPSLKVISSETTADAYWWVKLNIDISHHLSWHVVQELGFVLNYISLQEPMPTVFKPVSPPPYMNPGGPSVFLSWVIEPTYNYIDPHWVAQVIEGRLPRPVSNEDEWGKDDDDV